MEIRIQGVAYPCIAQEDIKEGLAVKLGAASGASLPTDIEYLGINVQAGASLPTEDEDAEARYVAAFRVYNEKPPLYEGLTTLDETGNTTSQPYTLRGWVAGSSNLPATGVTLRMTTPRIQSEQTILSGALMLAYGDGVYTVTSGTFTATSFVVGDLISAGVGGLWQKLSTSGRVGQVLEYDATNSKLTIKTGR